MSSDRDYCIEACAELRQSRILCRENHEELETEDDLSPAQLSSQAVAAMSQPRRTWTWAFALGAISFAAVVAFFGLLQAGRSQSLATHDSPTSLEAKLYMKESVAAEKTKRKHVAAENATHNVSSRELDLAKERKIVETFGPIPNFLWGVATSAYQVEGAWNEGGRSESIWDVFCHEGRAFKGGSGDTACNYYYNWRWDLDLISQYGFNTYRFSISWTRVLPFVDGKPTPNGEGISFYKNILADLFSKGITPMVTMFHWDLPKQLDWREPEVVDYFVEYAQFLLKTFPEVKLWASMNEPFSFCFLGYNLGIHAPGVWSHYDHYKCGHHVILAHAQTFDYFRRRFSADSGHKLGIILNYDFAKPLHKDDPDDVESVQVEALTRIGWFADPIHFGDYPKELKEIAGEHLPNFTTQEKYLLRSGANHEMSYYGLNTYGGRYMSAKHGNPLKPVEQFWKNGKPIGEQFIGAWLYKVPEEILMHLRWVNSRYHPPRIYITENGCPDHGDTMYDYTVNDWFRVSFYRDYLAKVAEAVEEGIPVQGYVAWALMDNFEWADGYKRRFGLTYVDFGTQKRTPKQSAHWWTGLNSQLRTVWT